MSAPPLLRVDRLSVSFPSSGADGGAPAHALHDISFSMGREKLAVVGESGSGKSTLGKAIMGLLAPNARMSAKALSFDGIDLLAAKAPWGEIRGPRIGLIFQDARTALDPVMTIGAQMAETLHVHQGFDRGAASPRIHQSLQSVEIRDPGRVAAAYPHELSGGLCQRVMIAMALLPAPDLLIADEPTSALDVSVRQGVLDLLDSLMATRNMGLVFISHDLNLVGSFCDRVLVLYGGHLMEEIAATDLENARHPYTRGLLACRPQNALPGDDIPVLVRDPAWLAGGVS